MADTDTPPAGRAERAALAAEARARKLDADLRVARTRLKLDAVQKAGKELRRPRGFYDGAGKGRRYDGWRTSPTGPNAEARGALRILRDRSRDLARNNPWASRAIAAVTSNVVGWGISYAIRHPSKQVRDRLTGLAKRHLDTTAIDAAGGDALPGLQRLAMRSIAEGGEVLLRRRRRFSRDGLPLPFQVQLLESDHLDQLREGPVDNGGYIVQGVEYDQIGRKVAYWLYPQHPGETGYLASYGKIAMFGSSVRVPAEDVIHCFRTDRVGQNRGVPWLAAAMMTIRDLADFEDAKLLQQKVAACFAVIETTPDGDEAAITNPLLDMIEPGMVYQSTPGRTITVVDPPNAGDFDPFTKSQLRKIAACVPVPYEVLSGNLSDVNYSSGRMGWLEFQRTIEEWRWLMLIPKVCGGIAKWFLDDAAVIVAGAQDATFEWHPPPRAMIDPSKEIAANLEAVSGGLTTWSRLLREQGYDPEEHFAEYGEDMARIEPFKLASDPRVLAANPPGKTTYTAEKTPKG